MKRPEIGERKPVPPATNEVINDGGQTPGVVGTGRPLNTNPLSLGEKLRQISVELGPLAQRSLKLPCTFSLPILSPSSLKGQLKESEAGILRAVVARVRKHYPQRREKREKGKKGESKLASIPVPAPPPKS